MVTQPTELANEAVAREAFYKCLGEQARLFSRYTEATNFSGLQEETTERTEKTFTAYLRAVVRTGHAARELVLARRSLPELPSEVASNHDPAWKQRTDRRLPFGYVRSEIKKSAAR